MPPDPQILVAGAAHWDLIARTKGPVAFGDDLPGTVTRRPGGVAANVALHLARDLPVTLAACIGDDAEGVALRAHLTEAGITLARVPTAPRTDSYLAIEDGAGALVAGIADTESLDAGGAALIACAAAHRGPVILDGNLAAEALANLDHPDLTLVPASPAKAARLRPLIARGAAVICNRAEAAVIAERDGGTEALAVALLAMGAPRALVTDGARPATLATADGPVTRIPPAVTVRSVTGAGDALVAGLVAALQAGASPSEALEAALARSAAHIQGAPA